MLPQPHLLTRYLRYIFDGAAFRPRQTPIQISSHVKQTALNIRGANRQPALLIHGMSTRSGTVFIGELLRKHPSLYAFPNDMWEFPLLQHSHRVENLQDAFLKTHEQNIGKMGEHDFLPLLGAAHIANLYAHAPENLRILLKVPSVERLDRFPALYPHENLLILLRDGRDLVHSTIKTWPQITFEMACLRWRRAANMVLAFQEHFAPQTWFLTMRFEEAVQNPTPFVQKVCEKFHLDSQKYPYDEAGKLPIRGSSTHQRGGAVVWDPIDKDSEFRPIGHWHNWSKRKKWTFKQIAGKQLIQLGYAVDSNW